MKCTAVVLGLGFAFLLALPRDRSIAGEASPNDDGYWECRNMPIQDVAYFSAIFEANASRAEVAKVFAQMLAVEYGYQGSTNCGVAYRGPTILAKLQDDQARYIKQLQDSQVKVVETGWLYVGDPVPAPQPTLESAPTSAPESAPAAAASPSKLWVCRGNTNAPSRDMYITAPFPVGTTLMTMRQAQAALASYMQENYQPTSMMCDSYATQEEANARVEWLVNFAQTNHFVYVPVNYTYQ
jgi:hypothetical protein